VDRRHDPLPLVRARRRVRGAWLFDCLDQQLFNLAAQARAWRRSSPRPLLLADPKDVDFDGGLATCIRRLGDGRL